MLSRRIRSRGPGTDLANMQAHRQDLPKRPVTELGIRRAALLKIDKYTAYIYLLI